MNRRTKTVLGATAAVVVITATALRAAEKNGESAWGKVVGAVARAFFGGQEQQPQAAELQEVEEQKVAAEWLGSQARPSMPAPMLNTSHAQVRTLKLLGDHNERLASFCLNQQGDIVALLSPASAAHVPVAEPVESGPPVTQSEVRVINSKGEEQSRFSVDFVATTVNVSPDGHIYVGGQGVIAKYDAQGQQLVRRPAPHLDGLSFNEEALAERAKASLAETAKMLEDSLAEMKQKYESTPEEELPPVERSMKKNFDRYEEMYARQIEQYSNPTDALIEQTITQLTSRKNTINAISANDQYVFVTCPASKGYGFTVWRTDTSLENGQLIVEGLRGCCGQMDVQCCGENLFVAENSRYRVVQYDADGEQVAKFGERSREGDAAGFSGCCNPMNTRLVGDKLYVAESDGTVKLFNAAGEFQEVLGKASVVSGCKSSIVAASADGATVYYFDVNQSSICVLERRSDKS